MTMTSGGGVTDSLHLTSAALSLLLLLLLLASMVILVFLRR